MKTLKLIYQKIVQLIWALPHALTNAGNARRQRAALNELEVERLDRLRNPSKYWGK